MESFIDELRWRGLVYDATPGLQARLAAGPLTGYVGFDPTAESLQVGTTLNNLAILHAKLGEADRSDECVETTRRLGAALALKLAEEPADHLFDAGVDIRAIKGGDTRFDKCAHVVDSLILIYGPVASG